MSKRNRILNLWADALASGEYEQAKGGLRNEDGFCCLGVLCDLHRKEVADAVSDHTEGWAGYGQESYYGESNHCPEEVTKWAGLTEDELTERENGSYDVLFKDTVGDVGVEYRASTLNDGIDMDSQHHIQESFEQISVRVRNLVS